MTGPLVEIARSVDIVRPTDRQEPAGPALMDDVESPRQSFVKLCIVGYALVAVFAAAWFFLIPGIMVALDVARTGPGSEISPAAWRLHHALAPRYEAWARARLTSGRAEMVSTKDVAGTEWPLFGSMFYLQAVEALQDAWLRDPSLSAVAPAVEARGAIDAAADLVADPGQAAWVRKHWGPRYLEDEDVFYRLLLISAITSQIRLTGRSDHATLLRTQVESMSDELARAKTGLLDDYPGQCYPADVLTTVFAIQDADTVLGTDHTAFVQQARRAFEGPGLDALGLVPYMSDPQTGLPRIPSRGCGNSYVSLLAPQLWPDLATGWYERYRQSFLQDSWSAIGFREFPRGRKGGDWYMDVDAGPVLAGHGVAASAYGVGAARANGHFEDAWPLTLEMLVVSWPLPNGTLALPRLLSRAIDAPYVGEASILYSLTRPVAPGMKLVPAGTKKPPFVFLVTSLYFIAGLFLVFAFVRHMRERLSRLAEVEVVRPGLQAAIWGVLLAGAVSAAVLGFISVALVILLVVGRLPWLRGRARTSIPSV